MENREVCIIIPTFNSHETTEKIINLLLTTQTNKNFDIIVVDCGSEDYKKLVKKYRKEKRIIIIHTKEDLGGSGSFWLGIKYALEEGYEIFILSDNDCIPISPNLIEEIVKEIRKYKAVKPKDISKLEATFERIGAMHFLSLHKSLVKKIGLPRAEFFIYCDDVEYYKRLEKVKIVNSYYRHEEKNEFDPFNFSKRTYYHIRNNFFISYLEYIKNRNIQSFLLNIIRTSYLLWKFLLPSLISKTPSKYIKFVLKVFNDSLEMKFGKVEDVKRFDTEAILINSSKYLSTYDYVVITDTTPLHKVQEIKKLVDFKKIYLLETYSRSITPISNFLRIIKYYFCLFKFFKKSIIVLDIPNLSCIITSSNVLYKNFKIEPKYQRNLFLSAIVYPILSLLITFLNIHKIMKLNKYTYLKKLRSYFDSKLYNLEYKIYRCGSLINTRKIDKKDLELFILSIK